MEALGEEGLPAASTITEVPRRRGCLDPAEAAKHKAFLRFENPRPIGLWRMDFKGHVETRAGGRRHPLTVLDDHSRYASCIAACANEQTRTVQDRLIETFQRYGLPERMTMDDGAPWGGGPGSPHTVPTVWLMRVGVGIGHSRPHHPRTQGKDARMHRSTKAEVMQEIREDIADWRAALDDWRIVYNTQRPHQALEGWMLENYRVGRMTLDELGEALGFETLNEIDGFLKAHGVWDDYSPADLRRDRQTLVELGL